MEADEDFVLDQLKLEQAVALRKLFKKLVRDYEKEELKGLNSKERAEHRKGLNLYYNRLFRVSAKPHPRNKRPSSAIKVMPPDAESLQTIKDLERRARELVERNEALKRQNGDLLVKVSAQLSNIDIPRPELQLEGGAVDLASISEQGVLNWLSTLPLKFDSMLETLADVDETSSKTNEKIKSLQAVAERKLKKPAPVAPVTASTSTIQPRTSIASSSSSNPVTSSHLTHVQTPGTPKAWSFTWRPQ